MSVLEERKLVDVFIDETLSGRPPTIENIRAALRELDPSSTPESLRLVHRSEAWVIRAIYKENPS